jgi:hypothetical protein
VQTVHGAKSSGLSRWLGPFFRAGEEISGHAAYPTRLADAITSRSSGQSRADLPSLTRRTSPPSSTVFILAPSRGAGDPTSIAWQSRPNSTPVPVVKTCLLIPLWLITGLLEISSLFLSRPPQALFASWAQPVFIMPLPIRRQRTWDGLEGQRARSTLNFTLVL